MDRWASRVCAPRFQRRPFSVIERRSHIPCIFFFIQTHNVWRPYLARKLLLIHVIYVWCSFIAASFVTLSYLRKRCSNSNKHLCAMMDVRCAMCDVWVFENRAPRRPSHAFFFRSLVDTSALRTDRLWSPCAYRGAHIKHASIVSASLSWVVWWCAAATEKIVYTTRWWPTKRSENWHVFNYRGNRWTPV